jgi:Tetratricopeptide repeat
MRALVVMVAAVCALASDALADENVELSRAHYASATAYFDQGDYERALVEFKEAAKFAPRPEFDFNIARCYELMGDAVRAVTHYRAYLDKRPKASDRADVEDALKRLGHRIGNLDVVGITPGTRLTLDGAPLVLGGDHVVPVTIGSHAVAAERRGMPTTTRVVTVRAGETVTVNVDPNVVTSAPVAPPPTAPERRRGRWKLWLGVGVGVAAVAALAVGLGVGLSASSGENLWSKASASCTAPCMIVDLR